MKLNEDGINLIKKFEGCVLTSYKDIAGIETVGWGHTGSDVKSGMVITQKEADDLLEQDLQRFATSVSGILKSIGVDDLSDRAFSALVSFAYNEGTGTLRKSSIIRYIDDGELPSAANCFLKYVYAGGKEVNGLLLRREAEKALFLA